MEIETTLALDGRPSLKELYEAWKTRIPATWTTKQISSQTLILPNGETVQLPIFAYYNAPAVDLVLIGGIHGREPAGGIALAREIEYIVEKGKTHSILVMPLLNPWGYFNHIRYGPSGGSVTDCDYVLGRSSVLPCPESTDITNFLTHDVKVNPHAGVLDLHEDPGYEAGGVPHLTTGTYLYIIGSNARKDPIVKRIKELLQTCPLPLMQGGVTRFHETIKEGIIENSPDGSIDEFFSVLGATPVLTLETLLLEESVPVLDSRVEVYQDVIHKFFD
jgi:hypothetical protein